MKKFEKYSIIIFGLLILGIASFPMNALARPIEPPRMVLDPVHLHYISHGRWIITEK